MVFLFEQSNGKSNFQKIDKNRKKSKKKHIKIDIDLPVSRQNVLDRNIMFIHFLFNIILDSVAVSCGNVHETLI